MVTRNQSIKNFDEKMSDLVNSKFIVAEKKISEVLITISDSVLLYELFKHAAEGFDYVVAKSVCFAHDAQGLGYFKLPKNGGDVLAFGLALLSEIDSGEIDIINLCTEYFPSQEGKQRSYSLFATQFLIPFQQTALRLAKFIVNAEDNQKATREEDLSAELENDSQAENGFDSKDSKSDAYEFYDSDYINQLIVKCSEIISTGKRNTNVYFNFMQALRLYQQSVEEKNYNAILLGQMAIGNMKDKVKKLKVDMKKITGVMAGMVK